MAKMSGITVGTNVVLTADAASLYDRDSQSIYEVIDSRYANGVRMFRVAHVIQHDDGRVGYDVDSAMGVDEDDLVIVGV